MPVPAAPAPTITMRCSRERQAERSPPGEEAGEGGGRRALDIVIEGGQHGPIAVEQLERVPLLEVLPLQERHGEALAHGRDELVHEVVVLPAAQARVTPAEVEVVVQQRLVVGAHVEADGQGPGGMDAGRGHVEGELAHGDAHAARALVAEAEDALVVGRHHEANVLEGRVAQGLEDAAPLRRGDPEPAGAAEDPAELLAGAAHRGGVDDGQELLEVVGEDAVEEDLVAVLERGEADEALQGVGLARDVAVGPRRLLLHGGDGAREQAVEPEAQPLLRA